MKRKYIYILLCLCVFILLCFLIYHKGTSPSCHKGTSSHSSHSSHSPSRTCSPTKTISYIDSNSWQSRPRFFSPGFPSDIMSVQNAKINTINRSICNGTLGTPDPCGQFICMDPPLHKHNESMALVLNKQNEMPEFTCMASSVNKQNEMPEFTYMVSSVNKQNEMPEFTCMALKPNGMPVFMAPPVNNPGMSEFTCMVSSVNNQNEIPAFTCMALKPNGMPVFMAPPVNNQNKMPEFTCMALPLNKPTEPTCMPPPVNKTEPTCMPPPVNNPNEMPPDLRGQFVLTAPSLNKPIEKNKWTKPIHKISNTRGI